MTQNRRKSPRGTTGWASIDFQTAAANLDPFARGDLPDGNWARILDASEYLRSVANRSLVMNVN